MFGATAVKSIPVPVPVPVTGGVCGADEVDPLSPHAASTDAAPTPIAAVAVPVSTDLRETIDRTTSPKKALSLVLPGSCQQASPHLYLHVTCARLDDPARVRSEVNNGRAMRTTQYSRAGEGR
ncbi:hypothetical protein GCM10009722_19470 [Williamsia deligens]